MTQGRDMNNQSYNLCNIKAENESSFQLISCSSHFFYQFLKRKYQTLFRFLLAI